MQKYLKDFLPGERGTVVRVNGEGKLRRRLFDMGLTPGVEVELRKIAPLGDPVEIRLRGYELSLRKSEAESVCFTVRLPAIEKEKYDIYAEESSNAQHHE